MGRLPDRESKDGNTMSARTKKNQGMNWLTPKKRLAIYLRDGLACAYCGRSIEDEARLTLDHLTPHSLGGSNAAGNLVTACLICNSSRGARSWTQFARSVANYLDHDVTPQAIRQHILRCIARDLR